MTNISNKNKIHTTYEDDGSKVFRRSGSQDEFDAEDNENLGNVYKISQLANDTRKELDQDTFRKMRQVGWPEKDDIGKGNKKVWSPKNKIKKLRTR